MESKLSLNNKETLSWSPLHIYIDIYVVGFGELSPKTSSPGATMFIIFDWLNFITTSRENVLIENGFVVLVGYTMC